MALGRLDFKPIAKSNIYLDHTWHDDIHEGRVFTIWALFVFLITMMGCHWSENSVLMNVYQPLLQKHVNFQFRNITWLSMDIHVLIKVGLDFLDWQVLSLRLFQLIFRYFALSILCVTFLVGSLNFLGFVEAPVDVFSTFLRIGELSFKCKF